MTYDALTISDELPIADTLTIADADDEFEPMEVEFLGEGALHLCQRSADGETGSLIVHAAMVATLARLLEPREVRSAA